jgi:hypothetical protein
MRHLLLVIVGACVLASGGCVSSDSMAVGNRTYPPRPRKYIIDVYLDQAAPVQVHKQLANAKPLSAVPPAASTIGRVDTAGAPAASWGSVVNDAKKRARTLGGDGLVINGWGSPVTAVDAYGQAYYGKHISMTVIRYSP